MSSTVAMANPFAPVAGRYRLPQTRFFKDLRYAVTLRHLAGYARAERKALLLGANLHQSLVVPLYGPDFYSPYGGGLVERQREAPAMSDVLNGRWQRALVVSPGTAILGLGSAPEGPGGRILARISYPIMAGKAQYFLWTAGVNATPLTIETPLSGGELRRLRRMPEALRSEQIRIWRAQKFAEYVNAIANSVGFINVEDAQGRDLQIILGALECLKGECGVWSDDMDGTGVVAAATVLAWAEKTHRKMENIKVEIWGAGAGAAGIYRELLNHGVSPENIRVTDRGAKKDDSGVPYLLHRGRRDIEGDLFKREMAKHTPSRGETVEEFAKGADVVINVGDVRTITRDRTWTRDIIRRLAPNPLVLLMTNPEPGMSSRELREIRADAYYGSGNQTDENCVNNFVTFGHFGAGCLIAQAGAITALMRREAALGILAVAQMGPPEWLKGQLPKERQRFGRHNLVPDPRDLRLLRHEAGRVARAAARDGVSTALGQNPNREQLAAFDQGIEREVGTRIRMVEDMRRQVPRRGRRFFQIKFGKRWAPFSLRGDPALSHDVPPEVDRKKFESFARQIGLKLSNWRHLITARGGVNPIALTLVLKRLLPATEGNSPRAKKAYKELRIIVEISHISPPLGLALAIRRLQLRGSETHQYPTIFHRAEVLRTVLQEIPRARGDILQAFEGIPELDGEPAMAAAE